MHGTIQPIIPYGLKRMYVWRYFQAITGYLDSRFTALEERLYKEKSRY